MEVPWGPVAPIPLVAPPWPFHATAGSVDGPCAVDVVPPAADGPPDASAPAGETLNAPPSPGHIPRVLLVAGVGATMAGLAAICYARLHPREVLAHPRRRRIVELVEAEPGIETRRVAEALGIRWTKAAYHVRRLSAAGHVVVRRLGRRTAIFPAAGTFRGHELAFALLRRGTPRRVHELLVAEPGLAQDQIAQRVGLHQSQVSRVLHALEAAGLVTCERGPDRRLYAARPPLESAAPPAGSST